MNISHSSEDMYKYGTPVSVETIGDETFVFWKKYSPNHVEFQYAVTRYDPVHKTHKFIAVLHGFATKDGVYVQRMKVDPKFRKRNIGRMLHKMVADEFRGKKIHLYSEAKAIRFHEKSGYKVTSYTGDEAHMEFVPERAPETVRIKPRLRYRVKQFTKHIYNKYFKRK